MVKKPILDRELCNSFRMMVGLPAWKHLEKLLNEWEREATTEADNIPLQILTVAHIGECRGVRKVLRKLFEEVDGFLV